MIELNTKNLADFLTSVTGCFGFQRCDMHLMVSDVPLFTGDIRKWLLRYCDKWYASEFIGSMLSLKLKPVNHKLRTRCMEPLPVLKFYMSDDCCQIFIMYNLDVTGRRYEDVVGEEYSASKLGRAVFLHYDFKKNGLYSLVMDRQAIVSCQDWLKLDWGWEELVHWLDEALRITERLDRFMSDYNIRDYRCGLNLHRDMLIKDYIMGLYDLYEYLKLYGKIDSVYNRGGNQNAMWLQWREANRLA